MTSASTPHEQCRPDEILSLALALLPGHPGDKLSIRRNAVGLAEGLLP